MSEDSASKLKALMRNNTQMTYGDYNFPNLALCAKTGTAEVEDGAPHSWFVGFSDTKDTPIAFVIIVENGAGSLEATSVAANLLPQVVATINK